MRAALRRQAAIALGVWAIAFFVLATAYAIPGGPAAALAVDDTSPFVGQVVRFDASASRPHDAGNGRIVGYNFSFGDGTSSGWSDADTAAHAYAEAGMIVASVTVLDARGLTGQASVTLWVGISPPPVGTTPDLVPLHATFMPAQPADGDTVTVSVTILNRGGAAAASATVDVTDVQPDGTTAFLRSSPLPGPVNASATVVFTSAPFRVSVVGNHTFSITVANVTPAEPASADHVLRMTLAVGPSGTGSPLNAGGLSVSPIVWGLAAAGVAAGAGAVFFLRRPRPPGPLEPPPAEPVDKSPPPIWPP